MTHEEIDLLTSTPNDYTLETLPLLLDEQGVVIEEIDEQKLARLTLLNAELLVNYKLLQRAIEDARLEEVARIEAENAKVAAYNALDERFLAHYSHDAGMPWRFGILDDSNPLKAFRDLASINYDEALAKLEALEAAKVSYDANMAVLTAKLRKREVGRAVDQKCVDAYHHITGHNLLMGLTIEQIDDLERDFAQIQKALKGGRPDKAAALISAVTDPAYAELKVELLEILGM